VTHVGLAVKSQVRLPPGQQLAAAHKWPSVGERSAAPWSPPWIVEICGLARRPLILSLAGLAALPQTAADIDIHCVTRWSKLDQRFAGVLLADLLARAGPLPGARFVSLVARSERNHSTSLVLAEALALGTLIATQHAGQPLPEVHGGPVRAIVPGRYFYKSLKWLTRIELLADDRLGYWEAQAGYHNHGDPWNEERYLAPAITRQAAAAAIASRDFRGLDLRSIDASGRDLSGLQAQRALLRDADFRDATLTGADFGGANLSNARLARASLQGASFQGADVEGADFCGADLSGADFRGASLLGVTFVNPAERLAATMDGRTQFDVDRLEDMFPEQAEFVRTRIEPGQSTSRS
jgi:DMSO/TMAO reductase YedYZ molybdopterin-dependent catalytic subunit